MYKIINSDLTAIYFSKQRSISGDNFTTKERITLNISEKFLEMLKLSFKVLSFSLNEAGKFSRKDNKTFNMLESRICKMLKPLADNKNDTEFDNIIAFTLALFNLGVIYVKIIGQIKEDTHSLEQKAEEYFQNCLYLLTGKELDRKAILIVMKIYNKLAFIWKIWIKPEDLQLRSSVLFNALNMYVKYTKDEYANPIDIAIILGINNEDAKELDTKTSLDNLHIENLKELSMQYIHDFSPDKSNMQFVNYMHNLLNNLIKEESIDIYYNDWALSAAQLSRYFIHHNRFIEAKNCLAAASCMLEKYKEKLNRIMTEITTNDNQKTDLDLTFADLQLVHRYECAKINKLWGQYGVQLLHASKEKLLPNKKKQSCESDDIERECSNSTKSEKESANCLIFTNLEKEIKDKIIQICDKYVLNSSDIKIVFEKVLTWFDAAMEYFTMKDFAKCHGEIILNISLAYKYLAGFERCKDKQMNIYKQQITLLHNAIKKLPHKTALNNIRKLMWLEMGISYAATLDILGDGLIITDVESDQQLLLEIKTYMHYSMYCFQSYLEMP